MRKRNTLSVMCAILAGIMIMGCSSKTDTVSAESLQPAEPVPVQETQNTQETDEETIDIKELIVKTIAIIETEPNFTVNGSPLELEAGYLLKPIMKDGESEAGSMMVPMRDIFKTLSSPYRYEESSGEITLGMNGSYLTMTVGSTEADMDGETLSAPFAPELVENADGGDTVYLPIQFVFESLGCDVDWGDGRKRLTATCILIPEAGKTDPVKTGGEWAFKNLLNKEVEEYRSDIAEQVGDSIIGYQNQDGGWMKHSDNLDMDMPVKGGGDSTVDNNATITQLRFLAKLYTATGIQKYKDAFMKGIDYLLDGQHESGGWTQFFPVATGYFRNITINDDAMSNILQLLIDIADRKPDFEFVASEHGDKSAAIRESLDKGIQCILDLQIEVDGIKTGWASQYDPKTLEPTFGRAYEMPAIASSESVKVVKFLMSINNPEKEIIQAVDSCMEWFDKVKVEGKSVYTKVDYSLERGYDRMLVDDPDSTVWARFYEISSEFRPLFSGRDSDVKYDMADISYERRNGYTWYGDFPEDLPELYSEWRQKLDAEQQNQDLEG